MKLTVVAAVFALTSCAVYEPPPAVQVQRSNTPPVIRSVPDPGAALIEQCDRLRLSSPEAHRLCILRGIDRLGIERGQPPLVAEPQAAPIQILPHPYPPLAPPQYSIPVYPQCIGCPVQGAPQR